MFSGGIEKDQCMKWFINVQFWLRANWEANFKNQVSKDTHIYR